MSNALLNREEPAIFRYGFLSSRTSAALKEYLDQERVSEVSREVLRDAGGLLKDIVFAQGLFRQQGQLAASPENALDAFRCALEVIVSHKAEFGIQDVQELAQLFETIDKTLQKLATLQSNQLPSRLDVEKTRMFFQRLAKLMLAQLSIPLEGGFSGH